MGRGDEDREPGSEAHATPARTIRVYVVDDHAMVRRGLRSILEGDGGFEVVGEAASFPDGLRGILETIPDVALIDLRIPGGGGTQLIREVRSRRSGVPCILITAFDVETAFTQAALAGAIGFLPKAVHPAQLIEAVRSAAAGESILDRSYVEGLLGLHEETVSDRLLGDLSPQERRVLEFVAQGRTNREIAEELDLAEKTVRNYVSNILAKLKMTNRTQVAAFVARRVVERGEPLGS